MATGMQPAPQLQVRGAVRLHLGKAMAGDGAGVRVGARQRALQRRIHIGGRLLLHVAPLRLCQQPVEEVRLELGQRVIGLLHGQQLLRLVRLGVLAGVAAQAWHLEPQQGGALAGAHVGHRLADQPRRLVRVGAVTILDEQVLERRQVLRNVAAGRLELRGDGDAVAVVLDVEEQRQGEGGGHRQRRPETVGGHRGLAAEHDRQCIAVRRVAEHVAVVGNGLGPARAGGELRADVTRHRQHRGAAGIGEVADHADIATVAEPARLAHRARKGVLD
jgi:hypothetical protein